MHFLAMMGVSEESIIFLPASTDFISSLSSLIWPINVLDVSYSPVKPSDSHMKCENFYHEMGRGLLEGLNETIYRAPG